MTLRGDDRDETTVEETEQFVLLELEDRELGLPILSVREIVRMQEITEIPDAPDFVEGVINLRGEIIPVVDLAGRVGQAGPRDDESAEADADAEGEDDAEETEGERSAEAFLESFGSPTSRRIVVAEIDGRSAGLIVDGISRIVRVPASRIAEAPDIVRGVERRYVTGVAELEGEDRLIVICDLQEILRPGEKEAIGSF